MDSVAGSACGLEGVTIGSGARTTTVAVAVAKTSRVGVIVRGGSNEAIEDEIISVVPMTGATVVGARTRNSGGVGYPMSSLKVAPNLLETGVSVTSTDVDRVGVKPMTIGVKC